MPGPLLSSAQNESGDDEHAGAAERGLSKKTPPLVRADKFEPQFQSTSSMNIA
jgi:hypothetical protein